MLVPRRADFFWVCAFLVPYAAVFLVFAAWPLGFGLWLGARPELFAALAESPSFQRAAVNTLIYVTVSVNLTMFPALLLSGFFINRDPLTRALLAIFLLPWALPSIPAFVAVHWMLVGKYGFLNSLLDAMFGIEGPIWFNSYFLALGANIIATIWKFLPFWTLVFLAARMAIPRELNEAAAIDGATTFRRFVHITFPMLAGLYLICTLLATVWTIGDFSAVNFVSGGAPALTTEVLATHAMREAFTAGNPPLAVAASLSALPLLIPLTILLMRRVHLTTVQL